MLTLVLHDVLRADPVHFRWIILVQHAYTSKYASALTKYKCVYEICQHNARRRILCNYMHKYARSCTYRRFPIYGSFAKARTTRSLSQPLWAEFASGGVAMQRWQNEMKTQTFKRARSHASKSWKVIACSFDYKHPSTPFWLHSIISFSQLCRSCGRN